MPELPEVETYRRFIDEIAVGQTIAAVQVNDAHVLAQPEDELRAALTGQTTSPGIFDVLVALGRDESLGRIEDALAGLPAEERIDA